jgi:protein phosphatase
VLKQNRDVPDAPNWLEQAVRDMYLSSDKSLIWACSQQEKHYATCTSVTAILAGGYLAIAHLGDSRIILGYEEADGTISGEQATEDHKPDQLDERKRIEAHGGSVEYLRNHQNKPFIRGGDFTRRKALGEQPMQIQYSRAFGGKDLKMFGLSNEPTVKILRPKRAQKPIRWIVLASDGLWDVCDHKEAINIVTAAQQTQSQTGQSAAQALVQYALHAQKTANNNADNVTAVAVYIPPDGTPVRA